MKKTICGILILLSVTTTLWSQRLLMPQASQKASVTQQIGLTVVTISYNSPLVKGREIWGDLVPFGEVWRAGANENTTISFSTPVSIEGENIPAGTYGLHMIPSKDSWAIILSANSDSWGSFFYDPSEDVINVDVIPDVAPMQEWLSYRFTDLKASSAMVTLNWEKIAVGFLVQVDITQTVLESMRQELRGIKYYSWEGAYSAAEFCLKNKTNLDEAITWIDHSISVKETFANLNVKSGLLRLKGDNEEADKYKSKAMNVADELQLNAYGYQLLAEDKKTEAIAVFKMNVKRYPESWNVYDSLGDAYDQSGNNKEAIANFKIALNKAPENQKKRITEIIQKIQKKS